MSLDNDIMQADLDRWLQDRWNEGAATCVGLIRMAEAIRDREPFTIRLCAGCLESETTKWTWTELVSVKPCDRCGLVGNAITGGGTNVYK